MYKSKRWIGFITVIIISILALGVRQVSNHLNTEKKLRTLGKNGFSLVDVTEVMGIDFTHVEPDIIDPILRDKLKFVHYSTGVGVADVNNDGWMDILFLNAKKGYKNKLFINHGGKSFTEEAEKWGLDDFHELGVNTSPTFFDYDNDGKIDLYVSRMGCNLLFHNKGDHFENVTNQSGPRDCHNSYQALPVDVNHDGILDLYVLRYWKDRNYLDLQSDYQIFPSSFIYSPDGGSNALYVGDGKGHFKDVTATQGGADRFWSFDAASQEFYPGGGEEVYVANDFGPDELYKVDNGKMVNVTGSMGIEDRRNGMNVSLGDVDNSGYPMIYVSNIAVRGYDIWGNNLYKFDEKGQRQDFGVEGGVENCGWAWGAVFGDFDLDGREDLYVTNGFITGKSPEPYEFFKGVTTSLPGFIFSDLRTWMPLGDKTLAGNQVDCLFMNEGSSFSNYSAVYSPGVAWDGRSVGMIDLENNGALSLAITTQAGPAHILKNTVTPANKWIGFQLVGTATNRDAVGAKVRIEQEGWSSQYRWATGGKSGFMAYSDPRIHFGLRAPDRDVSVTVFWPRSKEQHFYHLRGGKYYKITEGKDAVESYAAK